MERVTFESPLCGSNLYELIGGELYRARPMEPQSIVIYGMPRLEARQQYSGVKMMLRTSNMAIDDFASIQSLTKLMCTSHRGVVQIEVLVIDSSDDGTQTRLRALAASKFMLLEARSSNLKSEFNPSKIPVVQNQLIPLEHL